MKKEIRRVVCIICLFMLFAGMRVKASSQAPFSFTINSGEAYTSASAYKTDTTDADIYPQSGTNYDKGMHYQVKDEFGTLASGHQIRYNLEHFNLSYKQGFAVSGNRCLYAYNVTSYKVGVAGVWYP